MVLYGVRVIMSYVSMQAVLTEENALSSEDQGQFSYTNHRDESLSVFPFRISSAKGCPYWRNYCCYSLCNHPGSLNCNYHSDGPQTPEKKHRVSTAISVIFHPSLTGTLVLKKNLISYF